MEYVVEDIALGNTDWFDTLEEARSFARAMSHHLGSDDLIAIHGTVAIETYDSNGVRNKE